MRKATVLEKSRGSAIFPQDTGNSVMGPAAGDLPVFREWGAS